MQNNNQFGICMPDESQGEMPSNFPMMQFPNYQELSQLGTEKTPFESANGYQTFTPKTEGQQPILQIGAHVQMGMEPVQSPAIDLMSAQSAMNLLQNATSQDQAQAQQLLFQQQIQAQQLYQQQLYQQQLYQQQVQAQQQQMMMQNSELATMQVYPGLMNTTEANPTVKFGQRQAEDTGIGQRVGTVNRWFLDKRSGWIRGDDGINLFVHYTDVLGTRQDLQEGERVSYYLGWNQKLQKQKAELVKPLVEKPLPPQQVTTCPLEGKVTRWDDTKNFGFIAYNTGSVFVHYSDLIGREKLCVGQHVSFEIVVNAACGKHKAVRVSVVEEQPTQESEIPAPPQMPTALQFAQTQMEQSIPSQIPQMLPKLPQIPHELETQLENLNLTETTNTTPSLEMPATNLGRFSY